MRVYEVYENIRALIKILKYKDIFPAVEVITNIQNLLKTKKITPYQIGIGDDDLQRALLVDNRLDHLESQAIKYLSHVNSEYLKKAMLYSDFSNLDEVILNYYVILDIYEKMFFKTIY